MAYVALTCTLVVLHVKSRNVSEQLRNKKIIFKGSPTKQFLSLF